MMPTHRARATGAARAERLEHDPVEDRRQQRQQRPASRGSRRSCRRPAPTPPSTRSWRAGVSRLQIARRIFGPVGDEVEREQQHREQLQQAAQRGDGQLHRFVALVADELLDAPSGSLKSSITSWASKFVPNVSLMV